MTGQKRGRQGLDYRTVSLRRDHEKREERRTKNTPQGRWILRAWPWGRHGGV